ENPCGRRWQGPTTELHRHWWTGPRQPSRRRSLEYASIAARRHRRQGLRQSNSASADQGRRGPADHPEPPQRDQTGLLSEAFLSAAAQDRKLLLSYQGLAAHRHPLRQTCSKFSCRRDPHRRTLLDQVVSPDPSLNIVNCGTSALRSIMTVRSSSRPIARVFRATAAPGCRDELLQRFHSSSAALVNSKVGCLKYRIHRSCVRVRLAGPRRSQGGVWRRVAAITSAGGLLRTYDGLLGSPFSR